MTINKHFNKTRIHKILLKLGFQLIKKLFTAEYYIKQFTVYSVRLLMNKYV